MKLLFLVLPLTILAGCDRTPKVEAENASVAEVADKVREANDGNAMIVRPGLWQSQVVLDAIDIPGMPPEAAAHIKQTMAKAASGHQSCLTEEQARKPKEDFFAGKNSNCRYDRFSMDDGKLSGLMRCTGPDGGTQLVQFDGNYSPEQYAMRMSSTIEGGGPGGSMKMAMRVSSKRVGDCDSAARTAAN